MYTIQVIIVNICSMMTPCYHQVCSLENYIIQFCELIPTLKNIPTPNTTHFFTLCWFSFNQSYNESLKCDILIGRYLGTDVIWHCLQASKPRFPDLLGQQIYKSRCSQTWIQAWYGRKWKQLMETALTLDRNLLVSPELDKLFCQLR